MSTSTIYDVAAKAGVSISTVSLAINAPTRVSPVTRTRVLAAVDELGFVPKTEAVTRARRGVGRIGVIAPFTSSAFFARVLNGVLRAARGRQLEVVVYDHESANISPLASLPLTRQVDGVIVMTVPLTDDVARRLLDQSVETVLVDQRRPGFSSVAADDVAAGRMVAEHLVARGCRRCGFVSHTQDVGYVLESQARRRGLRAGLQAAGIELADEDVRLCEPDFEAGRAAARELLDRPERPTAVVAHDDLLAGGVLAAARDLSIGVPEQLMVVGLDDSALAAPLGLTSVHHPAEQVGERALELLLAQLADPRRGVQETTLAVTLAARDSTRMPG